MEYLIFNKPKTNIQRAFGLFAQLEKIENAVEKLTAVLDNFSEVDHENNCGNNYRCSKTTFSYNRAKWRANKKQNN